MGRACVVVDVRAIRLIIDDVGVSTQSIENALSDIPAGTIGAVQADLDTFEGIDTQGDQITHITVASGYIIHSAADVLPVCKGQFRPILIKDIELSINVVLYQQQDFLGHFLAVAVDQFDSIVVVGVVAGGDHNAAVKVIHTGNVGHGRSGGDMEQISICTGSSQTSHQTIFKHIGAATRILTDDDTGRLFISVALTESIIIPAEKTPHLVCVVGC